MDMIVGQSDQIKRIKDLIRQVVNTDLGVVIYGESGVGKELVARALHFQSFRRNSPFVKVNCAALPSELLESELFGYEKGAFTGADRLKLGKFELANNGTILLDEIGDMPLMLQSKLLQVLQDGEFSRIGGKNDVKVNTWVIAATNHILDDDVKKGLFREDLFYRLNIIKICVPPLRERKEDIPLLVNHFLSRYSAQFNASFVAPDDMIEIFLRYHWPGNVREVENYVKRLLVLSDWDEIKDEIIDRSMAYSAEGIVVGSKVKIEQEVVSGSENGISMGKTGVDDQAETEILSLKEIRKQALIKVEREVIEEVLKRTNWNKKRAAIHLKISYKALLYKVKNMNIREPAT